MVEHIVPFPDWTLSHLQGSIVARSTEVVKDGGVLIYHGYRKKIAFKLAWGLALPSCL